MKRLVLALAILLAAGTAKAALPAPAEDDFVIPNFRFASGETLPELTIHYRTLGTPQRDASGTVENALLILHGTTGTGRQFLNDVFAGTLFGPGQLLDVSRYYVILPDGIGHGGSSKPSDGLHARFPRYDYDDMVEAQHRLLTEKLQVNHLRLVLGTSMGGMHAWVWAEKYPEFADGYVPLAAQPGPMSGRNRAWRRMIIDAIREDPQWKGGEYASQPLGLTRAMQLLVLMLGNPVQWQIHAPTGEEADRYLAEQTRNRQQGADANDVLYAFEASRDYDPAPGLERIARPLLAINFADDLINPPELGILEKAIVRVRRGRAVVVPAGPDTRGHGTHTIAAVWQEHLRRFLAELPD